MLISYWDVVARCMHFCCAWAAQDVLLRSQRPLAALEMRKDLKHWRQALSLAQQLAPASVAALSKEHAAMLEMVGEHAEARSHYQQVSQQTQLCDLHMRY